MKAKRLKKMKTKINKLHHLINILNKRYKKIICLKSNLKVLLIIINNQFNLNS